MSIVCMLDYWQKQESEQSGVFSSPRLASRITRQVVSSSVPRHPPDVQATPQLLNPWPYGLQPGSKANTHLSFLVIRETVLQWPSMKMGKEGKWRLTRLVIFESTHHTSRAVCLEEASRWFFSHFFSPSQGKTAPHLVL